MRVVLLSTYELGRQSFGLASPAAWLRRAGAEVTCLDLSIESLDEDAIRAASLVAFYLPMHTATRIAVPIVERVRRINPKAHLCCYGLYAPMNETYLCKLGVNTILGGEFETGLASLVERLSTSGETAQPPVQPEPIISLERQQFWVPERGDLPPLSQYAQLNVGNGRNRIVGYTEASRGCKHTCRHCPVVPVYEGRFRIVQSEIVLEDIRQQVMMGAEHITFGDPDFFNGIGHALPLIRSLHEEYPHLTYDVTIKIEHLLKYAEHLPTLRETGCLFVTSAVESIDDRVLELLDKGHTRDDVEQVIQLFREAGLIFQPTFVTFTPWTTLEGYRELLNFLEQHNLVEHVAPIQLAIRLLITAGSKLLDLHEVRELVGAYDDSQLVYPWRHSDRAVDQLQEEVLARVTAGTSRSESRRAIFLQVAECVGLTDLTMGSSLMSLTSSAKSAPIPHLTEPWYC